MNAASNAPTQQRTDSKDDQVAFEVVEKFCDFAAAGFELVSVAEAELIGRLNIERAPAGEHPS